MPHANVIEACTPAEAFLLSLTYVSYIDFDSNKLCVHTA